MTSWLNLYVHGVISLGEADCDREDVQKLEQTIKSDSFYVAGPVMAGQFSLDEESGYITIETMLSRPYDAAVLHTLTPRQVRIGR